MKKLLLSVATFFALLIALHAQQKSDIQRGGKKHIHHSTQQKHDFAKSLNLSAAQKAEMKANSENFKKQMQDLKKNEGITIKEFKAKKTALHKEQKATRDALLTPEQKVSIANQKADNKVKRTEIKAKKFDKMKTQLSLTDAQVQQLKAKHEATAIKMKAIKENEKLDKVAKKDQILALKKQSMEENKKIFTPEQLQKIEEMKKRKGKRKVGK